MKVFAFIFARGGSKGLPGKNIKKINGRSLLQRSIDTAKQCQQVSRVFVSTDDAAIAEEAEACGAELINRPAELATDTASEWLAWQHAVEAVDEEFDVFLSLPTTAPLRTHQDVEACINRLNEQPLADIVLTMSEASRSPYFNMVETQANGFLSIAQSNHHYTRRQDAPPLYDLTTVAYVTRPQYIKTHSRLFAGLVAGVEIPKQHAIDIDDAFDFEIAEYLLNKREQV